MLSELDEHKPLVSVLGYTKAIFWLRVFYGILVELWSMFENYAGHAPFEHFHRDCFYLYTAWEQALLVSGSCKL